MGGSGSIGRRGVSSTGSVSLVISPALIVSSPRKMPRPRSTWVTVSPSRRLSSSVTRELLPGRASRRRAPTPIRSAAARRTRSPAASRSITKRRQIRTGIRCFGKPRHPRFSWFAAERHRQVADIVGCTLAQRIVVTDLADPAINMLDAIRRAGSGREDVDDLAAQCRFAWPVDPLFEGVADPQQMCFQLVSRDGPARSKGNPTAAAPALREPAQVRAGHQRDAQRGARCAPHVSPRAVRPDERTPAAEPRRTLGLRRRGEPGGTRRV